MELAIDDIPKMSVDELFVAFESLTDDIEQTSQLYGQCQSIVCQVVSEGPSRVAMEALQSILPEEIYGDEEPPYIYTLLASDHGRQIALEGMDRIMLRLGRMAMKQIGFLLPLMIALVLGIVHAFKNGLGPSSTINDKDRLTQDEVIDLYSSFDASNNRSPSPSELGIKDTVTPLIENFKDTYITETDSNIIGGEANYTIDDVLINIKAYIKMLIKTDALLGDNMQVIENNRYPLTGGKREDHIDLINDVTETFAVNIVNSGIALIPYSYNDLETALMVCEGKPLPNKDDVPESSRKNITLLEGNIDNTTVLWGNTIKIGSSEYSKIPFSTMYNITANSKKEINHKTTINISKVSEIEKEFGKLTSDAEDFNIRADGLKKELTSNQSLLQGTIEDVLSHLEKLELSNAKVWNDATASHHIGLFIPNILIDTYVNQVKIIMHSMKDCHQVGLRILGLDYDLVNIAKELKKHKEAVDKAERRANNR